MNSPPTSALSPGGGLLRRRSRRALTLTEFLAAVAAVAILAVIAVPELNSTRPRVDSAVQSLATALYLAQREAVARRHDIVILFDPAQHRAVLLYDVNGNGAADVGERMRSVTFDDAVVFGRGIAPARAMGAAAINFTGTIGGLPAVIFHRDGTASSAGGFYLTSARAQATGAFATDARAIEVARATGRAEWWRYDGEGWVKNSVKSEK